MSLFRAGSARQVLAVHLPKSRSYMHLDTVITMCDRDLVTLDDLIVRNVAGYASYGTIGNAPNRIFVIEVREWEHYDLDDISPADYREGVAASADRRPPKFTGE